jgi:hypothetical protein
MRGAWFFYVVSGIMTIAPHGHSSAQIPHPLQAV